MRAGGGIGRRARFRSVCPKGRGGSTPPSRTQRQAPGSSAWGFTSSWGPVAGATEGTRNFVRVLARTNFRTNPGGRFVGVPRPMQVVQLVVSCFVLGVGVGLLLDAALGSDGFSTMVNGLHFGTRSPVLAGQPRGRGGLRGAGVGPWAPPGSRHGRAAGGRRRSPSRDDSDAARAESTSGGGTSSCSSPSRSSASASPAISPATSAPARPRRPPSPGTRRCRSSGATASCSSAAR